MGGQSKKVLSPGELRALKGKIGPHQSAAAVGAGTAVAVTAKCSLSVSLTAEATSVAVFANLLFFPLIGAFVAASADYYMQLYRVSKNKKGVDSISREERQAIWTEHSRPLAVQLGVALVGANLFGALSHITATASGKGLGAMLVEAIWPLNAMPYSLDLVMMVASGLGMALCLTAAVYMQKNKPTARELLACFVTGFFAGAAISIIPGLINQHIGNFAPDYAKHIISGIGSGTAVGLLFSARSRVSAKKIGEGLSQATLAHRSTTNLQPV